MPDSRPRADTTSTPSTEIYSRAMPKARQRQISKAMASPRFGPRQHAAQRSSSSPSYAYEQMHNSRAVSRSTNCSTTRRGRWGADSGWSDAAAAGASTMTQQEIKRDTSARFDSAAPAVEDGDIEALVRLCALARHAHSHALRRLRLGAWELAGMACEPALHAAAERNRARRLTMIRQRVNWKAGLRAACRRWCWPLSSPAVVGILLGLSDRRIAPWKRADRLARQRALCDAARRHHPLVILWFGLGASAKLFIRDPPRRLSHSHQHDHRRAQRAAATDRRRQCLSRRASARFS